MGQAMQQKCAEYRHELQTATERARATWTAEVNDVNAERNSLEAKNQTLLVTEARLQA